MYSMYQSGIDSPLFNMSRVVSTKSEQSVPHMVSQLEGELSSFRHGVNLSNREMQILIMLLKKKQVIKNKQ